MQLLFEELMRQSGKPTEPDPEAEAKEDASLEREIAAAENRRADRKQKARQKGPAGRSAGSSGRCTRP